MSEYEPLSEDNIALLRATTLSKFTDAEVATFVQTCDRTQLDPLARQIFPVGRWDRRQNREVMSIQVSIDGYRLVAARTGQYQGQTETCWYDEQNGGWVDVWLQNYPPAAAKVGVWRQGFREPLYGVARWSSYVQTQKNGQPNPMWSRMPEVMIAKVAEALALRKSFPNELSGVYTDDEMGQADDPAQQQQTRQTPPARSDEAEREAAAEAIASLPNLEAPDELQSWGRKVNDYGFRDAKPVWNAFQARCAELRYDPRDVLQGKQVRIEQQADAPAEWPDDEEDA